MKQPEVIAVGELLIDFTMVGTDDDGCPTMQTHPGGAPYNYLATLERMGIHTGIYAKIGDDTFGEILMDSIGAIGIDKTGIVKDQSVFTTLAFVTLDKEGNRQFSFARKPGADTQLRVQEINWKLLEQARVLHFGSLSLTDEPARTTTKKLVQYAREHGKLITFDPNLREPLWSSLRTAHEQILWGLSMADVVKISEEEAQFLFNEQPSKAAEKIINEYGAKVVFVTLGKDGCYSSTPTASCYVKNYDKVKTVDTTGAGDIFFGAAMCCLLQQQTPIEDLTQAQLHAIAQFACIAASLSTGKFGGIQSIPSLHEVEEVYNISEISCVLGN